MRRTTKPPGEFNGDKAAKPGRIRPPPSLSLSAKTQPRSFGLPQSSGLGRRHKRCAGEGGDE